MSRHCDTCTCDVRNGYLHVLDLGPDSAEVEHARDCIRRFSSLHDCPVGRALLADARRWYADWGACRLLVTDDGEVREVLTREG